MILRYGNQEIDLFGDIQPDRIVLSLSGGLDSTSLFYLISKFFPDVSIIPATAIDAYAKFDAVCAFDTVKWMQKTFPQNDISDVYSFEFDHTDPYWLKKADSLSDSATEKSLTQEGTSKNLQMTEGFQRIFKQVNCNFFVTATTANPPDAVMKQRGFFDIAEPSRNEPRNRPNLRGNLYQPYINVDKKFVAGVYKQHILMEELYPFTSSCVGMPEETDYGQKECGQCFWCQEKKWGFTDEG
jgi:hypothetical protein